MVCKSISLAPFTPPQSHGLAVFLEFSDQRITMLHHIRVLLVLVVGSVRLDNPIDAVDRARNAVAGDEFGQIPTDDQLDSFISRGGMTKKKANVPIQIVNSDTKVAGHALQSNHPVALEQLLVGPQPHFPHKPGAVLVQVPVLSQEVILHGCQTPEEQLVVAIVETAHQVGKRGEIHGLLILGLVGRASSKRGEVDRGLGLTRGCPRGSGTFHLFILGTRSRRDFTSQGSHSVLTRSKNSLDLCRIHHFFFEVHSLQGQAARKDRVDHERRIAAKLIAGKCRQTVQEERGSKVVRADREQVQSPVCLEAIPPVPVTSILDESAGPLNVFLDR